MKTRTCELCGRTIPAETALHCISCDKCYCERCAKALALCECSGELEYFD